MKMSFSITVWKYALLALSILISGFSVILISVGVITLGGAGSPLGAYIITAIGCIVLTLWSMGCFAALRESYILSMIYVGFGAFTVVCQTVFMITFAAMKEDFIEMTKIRVQQTWEKVAQDEKAMYSIELSYECCGIDSPQDYLKNDGDKLPSTCCRFMDCSDDNNIFAKGCETMAVNFIDKQSDNLILTLVGLVAFEALSMIAGYYLAKSVADRVQKSEPIVISE